MRAFIKTIKWAEFLYHHRLYGFLQDDVPNKNEKMFVRCVKDEIGTSTLGIFLIVTMDRELHLVTPMGESPFMEAHKKDFEDLIEGEYIEFVKGEYD